MIRLDMLRVLFHREFRRVLKNPMALIFLGLLGAIAVLVAVSAPTQAGPPPLIVWVVYDQPAEWIDDLTVSIPDKPEIHVVSRDRVPARDGRPDLPAGHSLVELRNGDPSRPVTVVGHYIGKESSAMQPFWNWFWPGVAEFQSGNQVAFEQHVVPMRSRSSIRAMMSLEDTSVADLVKKELIGSVMLLIVMFFSCCHLLVSFTAQDRERGTLTALALSPARTSEIMSAKFCFHLLMSVIGSVIITGILVPGALLRPVFWVALILTSLGLMSVATCMTAIVKTQASAALMVLSYMLGGAMLFYLATQFSVFAMIKRLSFESYSFPLIYLSLKQPIPLLYAPGVATMFMIVAGWLFLARHCFFRFGWR